MGNISLKQTIKDLEKLYSEHMLEIKKELSEEDIEKCFSTIRVNESLLYENSESKIRQCTAEALSKAFYYCFIEDKEVIRKIFIACNLQYSIRFLKGEEESNENVDITLINGIYNCIFEDSENYSIDYIDYRITQFEDGILSSNLITLKEYAKMHHVADSTIRCKIRNGSLQAVKKGRDWFIDINEPYCDRRLKEFKINK